MDGLSGNEKLRRHHHIVPRFHLLQFADERNRVMRVVLPGDRRYQISISRATVEKDFYLVEQADGRKNDGGYPNAGLPPAQLIAAPG